MFIRTAAAAATLLAFGQPGAAYASEHSIEVQFGDLDMATESGRAGLDARIKTAVRHVCGRAEGPSVRARVDMMTCRSASLAGTMQARDRAFAQAGAGRSIRVAALGSNGRS